MKKNIISNVILLNSIFPIMAMEAPSKPAVQIHRWQEVLDHPFTPGKDVKAYKAELLKRSGQKVSTRNVASGLSSIKPSLVTSHDFKTQPIMGATYTPNDENLVVALAYALTVLNPANLSTPKLSVPVQALNVVASPNNSEVALCTYPSAIQRYDLEFGASIATLGNQTGEIQYNCDGTQLLSATNIGCDVWDIKSNKKIQTLLDQATMSAQWNPTNRNQIALNVNNTLKIFDMRQNKAINTIKSAVPLYILRYTNLGYTLVCSSQEQTVEFDAENGEVLGYYSLFGKKSTDNKPFPIPQNPMTFDCLTMLPGKSLDDIVVTALADSKGDMIAFDLNGKTHFTLSDPGATPVATLALSSDGKRMVEAQFADTILKVWDLTGKKPGWCSLQ